MANTPKSNSVKIREYQKIDRDVLFIKDINYFVVFVV